MRPQKASLHLEIFLKLTKKVRDLHFFFLPFTILSMFFFLSTLSIITMACGIMIFLAPDGLWHENLSQKLALFSYLPRPFSGCSQSLPETAEGEIR
jgi:hypothetical protein